MNEINIELQNNGARWIKYTFKPIDVGDPEDTSNIEMNIPLEKRFLGPNETESTKIEVKVIKMCSLINATLDIYLSDPINSISEWSMTHTILVKPEKLELEITCSSDKLQLDFQYIAEEAKVLPIMFCNHNSVNVPIELSIQHVRYQY